MVLFKIFQCSWLLFLTVTGSPRQKTLAPRVHQTDCRNAVCAVNPRQKSFCPLPYNPGTGTAAQSPLDVFEVYKPLQIPSAASNVQNVLLLNHSFGNSYGQPFVGTYEPPPDPFTNVYINLTVTSQGRQFDRLAFLFLGDTEVFRTSTAEPTPGGIIWIYSKDLTQYLSLWREPQKVIFDLGNLISDIYTGSFNVTAVATFFSDSDPPSPPDVILPISAARSSDDQASTFSLPADDAISFYAIPSETQQAIISIAACGQADEEFWYSNVPSNLITTWEDTTGDLFGFSAFREVQLLIDGMLAGVVWPFPSIFTGGLAPGFWKPEVGIDAFDLREQEIDITPFLSYLTDGKQHSFQIQVAGLDQNGTNEAVTPPVGNYWAVTGKIFLFTSSKTFNNTVNTQVPLLAPITHSSPEVLAPNPSVSLLYSLSQTSNHTNTSLTVNLVVTRSISIFSSTSGTWTQNLAFTSYNLLSALGLNQTTRQATFLSSRYTAPNSTSSISPPSSWGTSSMFPLEITTNVTLIGQDPNADANTAIGISAALSRGLYIWTTGSRADLSPWTLNPFSTPSRISHDSSGDIYPIWVDGLCTSDPITEQICKEMFNTSTSYSPVSLSIPPPPPQSLPRTDNSSNQTNRCRPYGLYTLQRGTAHYSSQTNASYSFGSTDQNYVETSRGEAQYVREVWVRNGSVVFDEGGF